MDIKSIELAKKIREFLEDKIAKDTVIFEIAPISSLADYFIIATGSADTHVKAIAEYFMVELKKEGIMPAFHEGLQSGVWVCVDYSDVIVHIMREDEREFYDLESIWGGSKKI